MNSSEKATGKEKVETMEASKTISSVGGERNPSAAGGLFPGDGGAYASPRDEATDVWAQKMLHKIDVVLKKTDNYTASKSISTAPASTEDRDKKLYEPRAVAIGPYHRKTEGNHFRITDEHKLWCVQKVIGASSKQDLGKFLGKMKEREGDAVKFYRARYGTDYNFGMDSQSFLEMLMLDSCFILLALSFHYGPAGVLPVLMRLTKPVPWAQRDIARASELVKTDLLLLDNQIPFFILEDVFRMKNDICPKEKMQNGGNEGKGSIRKVALEFFHILHLGRNNLKCPETTEVDHLLRLYHMHLEPPSFYGAQILLRILPYTDPHRSLPSAAELQRKSAVNFYKVKKMVGVSQSVLDVTTGKFGDIQMPLLLVNDRTNILLHNLISFEQPLGITGSYVTAYAAFLHHIVQREDDVELLENSGVLEHRLTGRAEVVALFRQLHYVIDSSKTPGYLAGVYEEVNRCCKSKWRRTYADAKQRYCSNVWLSISFVAGIALSVLTFIETIYAIIGYYEKLNGTAAS